MDRLLGWAGEGGWFGDGEAAVGGAGEGGGVGAEELAGPPDAFEVFLGGGREPVLPEYGADEAGLVGGVDAGADGGVLGLVEEGVGGPVRAVV